MFTSSLLVVLLAVVSASASPFKHRRHALWTRQANATVSNSPSTPSASSNGTAGCSANTTWQFDAENHMNVTMGNRSFLVHIPADYSATTPHAMVISYHGFKDNDIKQEKITGLSDKGLTLNGRVSKSIRSRSCWS